MSYADIDAAKKHYSAMRELIIHHRGGWNDEPLRIRLQQMSLQAADAVSDSESRLLLSGIDDYAADLFSETGHQKWARKQMSGADFLRLQILRDLDAFHARLFQLEASRNAAERQAASSNPYHRSSG
jgi:hypothetical protein